LIDLLKWIPGFETIMASLNLASLKEFEGESMHSILAALRIPAHVRWIALSALQPACGVLTCAEAQYQTWLLSLAWRFTTKSGDGVVAVDSATARNVTILSAEGPVKKIETWPDFVVPLEHWETVLDAEFFISLGVVNTDWIEAQQRRVFTRILESL
jgi:hypothetical protein